MPACRQCGRENPEGMAFCGYCATALARPAGAAASPAPTPTGDPASSPPTREARSPQTNKPFKPEVRTPSSAGKGKVGFELIPWSELSPAQRAGRSVAAVVLLFLVFFFIRGIIRGLGGMSGTSENAPSAKSTGAPITEGDRKDGIGSLCKVFQIYGLPKNDHDATEAARNAAELFKLAGNQSPQRSEYILITIAQEFRSGKLSQRDCADAGAPIGTAEGSTDNSTPAVNQ